MQLTYVLDYIFRQTPDGRIWTDTSYDVAFWQPYLDRYDGVTVVARVQRAAAYEMGWKEAAGRGVSVAAVPHYEGALDYARKSSQLAATLRTIFAQPGAVIVRVPSNLARCAVRQLDAMRRPYAVDVVGDPHEALAPGVVRMHGRPIFRHIFTAAQKQICARAEGVAYVAQCLRTRYPASPAAATMVCSDVRLGDGWLATSARTFSHPRPLRLLTVATLSQTYKGIDVLLKALELCRNRGHVLQLTIVGSGRFREELGNTANTLGLATQVHFTGSVAWGPRLRAHFDAADLFVLPSRVEVMPRALLEAMARALPAIATRVGAVAEILDPADIVQAGNAQALADRLTACAEQPATLEQMSTRNLATAHQFAPAVLAERWHNYQQELHHRFLAHPAASKSANEVSAAA